MLIAVKQKVFIKFNKRKDDYMKKTIGVFLSMILIISSCGNVLAAEAETEETSGRAEISEEVLSDDLSEVIETEVESDNTEDIADSADGNDDPEKSTEEKTDEKEAAESINSAEEISEDFLTEENTDENAGSEEIQATETINSAVAKIATSADAPDWTYTTINSTEARITGYKGTDRIVTIPNVIGGLPVREISGVFDGNKSITDVTIPTSIKVIGTRSFYNCASLRSVNIPESVTTIESNAFSGCKALKKIVVPSSVSTVNYYAFQDCISLSEAEINCVKLGEYMFDGCTSLNSLTFGSNVSEIGANAFTDCTALTKLTLGSGITIIGNSAFSGCTSLSSVIFNEGLIKINNNAFYGCTSLNTISLPSTVVEIDSAFRECRSLETAVLNNGLNIIKAGSFEGCVSLDKVNIPNTVVEIGDSTFRDCTTLTSITMGSGLKTIGTYAFDGCTSLKIVNLNNGLTTIGNYAFADCKSLLNISIPTTVSKINNYTFSGCVGLTNFVIPNSIESIGDCAFYGCSGLSTIEIPSSVNTIKRSFMDCTGIESIKFNEGLVTLDNSFVGCTSLKTVDLPSTLVNMPYAFKNCTSLYSASIKEGVTDGTQAFNGCKSLKEITVPSSITKSDYMFDSCTGLVKADVNSVDMDHCMFSSCTSLTDLKIGSNVKSIGESAFSNCKGLNELTLGENVVSLGYRAFSACDLYNVKLNENLTTIGEYAFYDNENLLRIVIPQNVVSISRNAFYRSSSSKISGMTAAIFEGRPPTSFGSGVFGNAAPDFKIFYKNPEGWSGNLGAYSCYPYPGANPSVSINDVSRTGFKVSVTGADILYPMVRLTVWSSDGGKDDIANYDCIIRYDPETETTFIDPKEILTSLHNDSTGTYNIEVSYADMSGSLSGTLLTTSCDVPEFYSADKPVITKTPALGGFTVTIASPLADAKIYYTTDGTVPTVNSSLYTEPILITSGCTLKAITAKKGYFDSEAAEEAIILEKTAAPALEKTPCPGGYMITASSDDETASIYYTLDGNTPTSESSLYTEPVILLENAVFKAVTLKEGMAASDVSEVSITFTGKEPTLVIDDAECIAGKYIYVPVKLVRNPGISAFALSISYDSEKMTPVSYNSGEKFKSVISNMDQNITSNPIRFQWDNMGDVHGDGVLFTVRFMVTKGQQSGETELTINYNSDDIVNFDYQDINPRIDNGKMTIKYVKKGDMSGDSRVANTDVLMLRRIISGYGSELTEEEQYAADVVDDGVINNRDLLRIKQFLAGYDVTLE